MLCGRVFVWSPLSGTSPRPDKKKQTNIRGAILYIQVSSIFNDIITLTGSTKYSQRLQTYCEPNYHTDIIRRTYLCLSYLFIRWPIPLAAMDQALIMSSIVLPMVHEFVQPLVLPAVPAVSLSRFRRAPSAVLGEFLLFFARSYMAMLAKVSDTSSGGVQAECRTIRTPLFVSEVSFVVTPRARNTLVRNDVSSIFSGGEHMFLCHGK